MSETTTSLSEAMTVSRDLRASTPEQMQSMVAELERIEQTAKDYVVPSRYLTAYHNGGPIQLAVDLGLTGEARLSLGINRVAHEQLAEKLGIPRAYYFRMLADPSHHPLMCRNINHWLWEESEKDSPSMKPRLIRTLDGNVRAFLSDRFRSLDNYPLFFHCFGVARDEGAVLQRLDMSEERLYMRLLQPGFAFKIDGRARDLSDTGQFFATGYRRDDGTWQGPNDDDPGGDWVIGGVVASNSDVGRGGLNVEAALFQVVCRNLAIAVKTVHKVHLGERLNAGIQIGDDTREAKDRAIWLEVRDLVKSTFNEDTFKHMVLAANNAQAAVLEKPVEAVDTVVKEYGLTEEDKQGVLDELMTSTRGATAWGLVSAVTTQAHKKGIEEEIALQRVGGQLLEKIPQLVAVRK